MKQLKKRLSYWQKGGNRPLWLIRYWARRGEAPRLASPQQHCVIVPPYCRERNDPSTATVVRQGHNNGEANSWCRVPKYVHEQNKLLLLPVAAGTAGRREKCATRYDVIWDAKQKKTKEKKEVSEWIWRVIKCHGNRTNDGDGHESSLLLACTAQSDVQPIS